ncbi:UNKNOWN [Stylonychia lemnae]|uniref:Uncharacterized protein n=1 Tax=Stylonychia lemnae TaxID=5949 RepID=A0A078AZ80_STYLE|nr:UNKNOWN [Stylonychia lemnae]|eukprot:CDW87449.1 UNKNOWN [Stylonychia lemnae]
MKTKSISLSFTVLKGQNNLQNASDFLHQYKIYYISICYDFHYITALILFLGQQDKNVSPMHFNFYVAQIVWTKPMCPAVLKEIGYIPRADFRWVKTNSTGFIKN